MPPARLVPHVKGLLAGLDEETLDLAPRDREQRRLWLRRLLRPRLRVGHPCDIARFGLEPILWPREADAHVSIVGRPVIAGHKGVTTRLEERRQLAHPLSRDLLQANDRLTLALLPEGRLDALNPRSWFQVLGLAGNEVIRLAKVR